MPSSPPIPTAFAFCVDGFIRFQVYATAEGKIPIEEAAGLLAMHCMVRSQSPAKYIVLAVPAPEMMAPIAARADQLLAAGRKEAGASVRLSVRQREVLDHVLRNLANKEIADKLNVTERTIKFHVSRLLAKFKVKDRMELKHEMAVCMLPTSLPGGFPK